MSEKHIETLKQLWENLEYDIPKLIFLLLLSKEGLSKYVLNKVVKKLDLSESELAGIKAIDRLVDRGILVEEESEKDNRKIKRVYINWKKISEIYARELEIDEKRVEKAFEASVSNMRKLLGTDKVDLKRVKDEIEKEIITLSRTLLKVNISFFLTDLLGSGARIIGDEELLEKVSKMLSSIKFDMSTLFKLITDITETKV